MPEGRIVCLEHDPPVELGYDEELLSHIREAHLDPPEDEDGE